MPSLDSTGPRPAPRRPGWTVGSSLLVGAGITFGLFSGMARFEHVETAPPEPEIADLHVMSIPMDVPPPRTVDHAPAVVETTAPMADLQIGASDSPVKIAVLPPELAMLYPQEASAPPANIEVSNVFTDLKPRTEMVSDPRRIYQQTEVDRVPTVLYRANPRIPSWIRKDADMLRVTLVLILDTKGTVTSARLIRPSGNPDFDRIVTETVQTQWGFTPALKNGKKVRCLLQQTVTVRWSDATPFGY